MLNSYSSEAIVLQAKGKVLHGLLSPFAQGSLKLTITVLSDCEEKMGFGVQKEHSPWAIHERSWDEPSLPILCETGIVISSSTILIS